jgi:hypothetical protein
MLLLQLPHFQTEVLRSDQALSPCSGFTQFLQETMAFLTAYAWYASCFSL